MSVRRSLLVGSLVALLAAPAAAGPVPFDRCDDLDPASLVQALERELPALLGAGSGPPLRWGRRRQTLGQYARTTLEPLLQLARAGGDGLCRALPQQFELVRLAAAERGHFSAYYHPVIAGSRTRTGPYQVPLYRRPSDPALAGLTTGQILAGGLDGKGLELVYLTSLGAALNVHIEGSATVRFADGSEVNLTTDGNNGHPYVNPFKLARQEGAIPKEEGPPPAPAPSGSHRSRTRRFFDEHPDLLRGYWARDSHFVFFKETPLRGTGKFGELVAGRSVAVDAERVPLGAALWMRTEVATAVEGEKVRFAPITRLALAQDTGAAIRGVGRVDIFVGSGDAAELAAALTSRPGELYLIVRRPPGRRRR